MSKKYKIIFAGTSEFAVPSLIKLSESDFINLMLVISQPDKPIGRKKELLPSPIKETATNLELNISQPSKIIELKKNIEKIKPDLGIVVSYGQIIPPEILNLPKHGWINLHPSLLPKYRGPAPLQNTILNGDKQTGISLIALDDKMDHGPIIAQLKYDLDKKYTTPELSKILSQKGAELLIQNISNYLHETSKPQAQDDALATFAKIINKEDGLIDWNKSADEIECQIRAYMPWPGCYTTWNNKRLKIISADAVAFNITTENSGQVLKIDNKLVIVCGKNALEVNELQLEGKAKTAVKVFLTGYLAMINQVLK